MRIRLASALLAASALACSSSNDTDTGTPGGRDGSITTDAGTVDAAGNDDATPGADAAPADTGAGPTDAGFPPGPVDIAGAWLARSFSSSCWNGPSGRDTVNTSVFSKITFTQNGVNISYDVEPCAIEFSPYKGTNTIYPEAAVRSIAVDHKTGTLDQNAYPAKLATSDTIANYGWVPTGDPRTDMLPTMANDARVRDSDADGNPGVTIMIMGGFQGSVYTVSRTIVVYRDLTFVGPNRLEGFNTTTAEQNSLGANPPILAFSVIQSSPNPDPRSSTNLMVRLPPNVTTCAQIRTMKDQLLGPLPTVTPCP